MPTSVVRARNDVLPPSARAELAERITAADAAATTTALLRGVRDAVVAVAGVPAASVWVYLAELPPAMMLEFGEVLPEPGDEEAWRAGMPADARRRLDALDGRA